jgi:VWFA-related protein
LTRPRAIAAAALLSLMAGADAPAQQEPRFEGGVEIVAVDANVVDAQGQPVRDLTAEEFVVKVDGRTRRVVSAEFVELRVRPSTGEPPVAPAEAGTAAAPSRGEPARAEGRRFVIVVDRGQLGGSVHLATQAVTRLLDQLGYEDRVAVFSLPSGPRLDFTSDRALIEKVLGKIGPIQTGFMSEFNLSYEEALTFFNGRYRNNGVPERECRKYEDDAREIAFPFCLERVAAEARRQVEEHERSVEERLNALEALCEALGRIPGPKALVLISGGFTPSMSGGRTDVAGHLRRIATAAAASRISVYSIYFSHRNEGYDASVARRPYEANMEEDRRLRTAGLDEFTGRAGGVLFEAVAGGDFAFDRVASETSAYYLLGLEPRKRDRDGKPHDIDVKVLRKGVEVRARRQFVMPAESTVASATRPRPLAVPAVPPSPLRVATHVLRGENAHQMKIVMAAEVEGFADARFDIQVLDPKGALIGTLGEQVHGARVPVRHQETILLPRGLYTLKALAVDAAGRRAVIERPLNAELSHGVGFDVSDLMLLESVDEKMRLSASGSIAGDTMGVYMELYMQEDLPTDRLAVRVEVIGKEGQRTATLLPLRKDAEKGLLYAEGHVDVWALPPGAYVARALVMFGSRIARTLERPFVYTGPRPE